MGEYRSVFEIDKVLEERQRYYKPVVRLACICYNMRWFEDQRYADNMVCGLAR